MSRVLLGVIVLACAAPAAAQIRPLDPNMLTVSSDPSVLVSRQYRLAWYVAGIPLRGHTLDQLDSLCAGIKTRVGGPWRAPTSGEMETLSYRVWPRQFDKTRAFHDTPERKHFGHMMPGRRENGYRSFPAKDWTTQDGRIFWYTTMRTYGIKEGSVAFESSWATDKRKVNLDYAKLICVSGYTPTRR